MSLSVVYMMIVSDYENDYEKEKNERDVPVRWRYDMAK